ncbi:MAG TPA: metallophosphoesterase [Planctomycetota bacterium]|jgi:bis(5'-nucleosyl)-tetraphosphatase (symmetrical)|nr:metallophosphoesterase [Planctomycetota bacterium]
MKRRIFIGDVQGCREELERLLERVGFDATRDELQPVGDFVNRGPDSVGVLRLCKKLGAGGVLGNHDVHLLRTAQGVRPAKKGDTFQDVLTAHDRDELLTWLAERPLVRGWNDTVLVHAGVHPLWKDPVARLAKIDPLAGEADAAFAISARYCTSDGTRPAHDWPPPAPPCRPWYEFWPRDGAEKRTVVFGHWARAGLVVRPQVRGLDTGCVWGGQLTAWIAEEDRIVQVDAARQYAPHE